MQTLKLKKITEKFGYIFYTQAKTSSITQTASTIATTATSSFKLPKHLKYIEQEEVESLEASFQQNEEDEETAATVEKRRNSSSNPKKTSATATGIVSPSNGKASSRTSSSSSLASHSESDSDTNILETQFTESGKPCLSNSIISDLVKYKKKSLLNIQSTTSNHSSSHRRQRHKSNNNSSASNRDEERARMCCTRRCTCIFLIILYVVLDLVFNAFFVTRALTRLPDFANFRIESSLEDVWLVSLVRDLFTFVVVLISACNHRAIYTFVRFVHKKYISSFMCLLMYSYAMIKMLLHADQRQAEKNNMFMFIWNIGASVAFFICMYMLALLKPKECNYQKTNVDGGDMEAEDENATEEDIFIETLKETNKKRSSLARLFRYSLPDLHIILCGSLFLLLGAICNYFMHSLFSYKAAPKTPGVGVAQLQPQISYYPA